MTPFVVHDFLRELGRNHEGGGDVAELGSWLGATARPLMEGLRESGFDGTFYMFDRWMATESEVDKAELQGLKIRKGQNLQNICKGNLPHTDFNVVMVKGNLPQILKRVSPEKLSIVLFDAPKRLSIFRDCINWALPKMIPGKTILGLLDYYSCMDGVEKCYEAPMHFIAKHNENFDKLAAWETQCSCAFFKYIKKI